MRLGILVDAACDLPRAFIAQNPIRMMPIPIRIGDRELAFVTLGTPSRPMLNRTERRGQLC